MHITSIGIDLDKPTFHLVALGEHSKVLVRKKVLTCTAIGLYRERAFSAHRP
jgi:hypothetical protein